MLQGGQGGCSRSSAGAAHVYIDVHSTVRYLYNVRYGTVLAVTMHVCSVVFPVSVLQSKRKNQKADVSGHAQRCQDRHNVAARPEPLPVQAILSHLGEELPVPCGKNVSRACRLSEGHLVGPCCRRKRLVNKTPAPYTANRAPME